MFRPGVTAETIDQLWSRSRKALAGGGNIPPELMKAITQATGLVWYDLEPYAKLLFPVITPLRNEIARVPGDGGTATHWISITGINITDIDIGLDEGSRGGSTVTAVQNNVATYKSFGLDDSVTFEADLAAENFDDVKKLAVDNLLRSVMIGEEKWIVGANNSLALGTTPTPSLTPSNTGGVLTNAASPYSVICVALSYLGYLRSSVAGGVPAQVTRTNSDGTTTTYGGGSAQKSAAAAATIAAGTTGSIAATVTPVNGAVAYAWYWGAAGSEKLGAITTINSYVIVANAAGTQTAASLPSSDNSTSSIAFDGLLTQIFTPGSGSTIVTQGTGTAGTGTPLTADGAGGIVEIDNALKAFWDNYKLSPNAMLVNSQELLNMTKKVIAGGSAPLFRFMVDAQNVNNPVMLQQTAGTVIGTYFNKFTMNGGALVQVLLHPNVPPGTIMFYSRDIPYPLSNVRRLLQMKMRRDYYQLEWPIVRPRYEYSVWANGLLQNYFPPAFGCITNIGNG